MRIRVHQKLSRLRICKTAIIGPERDESISKQNIKIYFIIIVGLAHCPSSVNVIERGFASASITGGHPLSRSTRRDQPTVSTTFTEAWAHLYATIVSVGIFYLWQRDNKPVCVSHCARVLPERESIATYNFITDR